MVSSSHFETEVVIIGGGATGNWHYARLFVAWH